MSKKNKDINKKNETVLEDKNIVNEKPIVDEEIVVEDEKTLNEVIDIVDDITEKPIEEKPIEEKPKKTTNQLSKSEYRFYQRTGIIPK